MAVKKKKTSKIWPMAFAGVVGAMTNTVLVLGGMWGLYTLGWLPLDRLNISALMPYLLGIMGTNGIPEAIFTAIVVPLIAHPLSRLTAKKNKKKWVFNGNRFYCMVNLRF